MTVVGPVTIVFSPDRPDTRNPGIDCLRGFAIILVIIHHLALRFPLTESALSYIVPYRILRTLNWAGPKGVTIFFVISGFLITSHSLERWGSLQQIAPIQFTLRRVARIMPCLLALITMLTVLGLLGVPSFILDQPQQSFSGAFFAALFMHLNLYEARTGYLPAYWDVLWSLSIEELFYLIFPILCLSLGRIKGMIPLVLLLMTGAAPLFDWQIRNASDIWQDKAYLPGMSAIATGVGAALLSRLVSSPQGKQLINYMGLLGCVGLATCLFYSHELWTTFGYAFPLILNLSSASLIWAFSQGWGEKATRLGTLRLRQWGQRSYEIYLTHMLIIIPLVALARYASFTVTWAWTLYPPALLLTFTLGSLVERHFSRPADRFLKNRLLNINDKPST